MRFGPAVVLFWALGCVPTETLPLETIAGANTVAVFELLGDEVVRGVAFDPADVSSITSAHDVELIVAYYRLGPDTLQMGPGELTRGEGRTLPEAMKVRRRDGDDWWDFDGSLRFELPAYDLGRCAEAQMCGGVEGPFCSEPCPAPPTPMATTPPTLPEPATPRPDRRGDCAAGSAQGIDEDGCAPVVEEPCDQTPRLSTDCEGAAEDLLVEGFGLPTLLMAVGRAKSMTVTDATLRNGGTGIFSNETTLTLERIHMANLSERGAWLVSTDTVGTDITIQGVDQEGTVKAGHGLVLGRTTMQPGGPVTEIDRLRVEDVAALGVDVDLDHDDVPEHQFGRVELVDVAWKFIDRVVYEDLRTWEVVVETGVP